MRCLETVTPSELRIAASSIGPTPLPAQITVSDTPKLKIFARAFLPTRIGDFEIVSFQDESGRGLDDVAIVRGSVANEEAVPARVHSECLTGDVFFSQRCDCREQLELALERLLARDRGVVLYMRQEGRGIGIAAKVGAYALQEKGMDTVDANRHLGFDDDLRSYEFAAAMFHALEIKSVVLQTNNPLKIKGLEEHGVNIHKREAILITPGENNAVYLATKEARMGHILDES